MLFTCCCCCALCCVILAAVRLLIIGKDIHKYRARDVTSIHNSHQSSRFMRWAKLGASLQGGSGDGVWMVLLLLLVVMVVVVDCSIINITDCVDSIRLFIIIDSLHSIIGRGSTNRILTK